jgi:multicomponent Na+:H+ antiporter subunit E
MKFHIQSLIVRALVFTALWALLSKNTWNSWPLAAVAILGGLATSLTLWPTGSWKWRFRALLRFIPFFLWESLAGGLDVARRAFSPRMPLDPAFIEWPLRLQSESGQVFFAWTVSLLPGTASVRLKNSHLKIHVLDQRLPIVEKLREVEDRVIDLFGESPD